ncbi:MAG: ATP-binding protein [Thermodesulfobacteriota bacterium]
MMKFRYAIYFILLLLMANLSAVTDMVLHPEIPFAEREHFIVGGMTALVIFLLFVVIEVGLRRRTETDAGSVTRARIDKGYGWPLAAIWTVIVLSSLSWNITVNKQRTLKIALIEAKTIFEKDLVYYRWATGHHGVFVPVSETTTPNPYLAQIADYTTAKTSQGLELTLVNPEYMIRQVYEMQTRQQGPYGHITSLDPIRPENAADAWEEAALEAFEDGVTEVSSVENLNGEKYLRLMRPMVTETGCLRCHASQGYQLGDIRGGISVSIPMAPLLAISRQDIFTFSLAHGTFWLLGLLGIYLGVQRLTVTVWEREQAEARVRSIIDNMFDGLLTMDEQGVIESCNQASVRMFAYPQEELLGRHIGTLLAKQEEGGATALRTLPAEVRKALEAPRELTGVRKDGSTFSLEISLSEMQLGATQLFIAMVRDITERNMAKNALIESQTRIIKQEKLASLGTMVAGIAHEINNPAQAISFSMDGLKMNIDYVKELVAFLNQSLADQSADPAAERRKLAELMAELDMELVLEGINDIADRNIQSVERIDHIVKSTKRMAHSEETFRSCDLNTIVEDAIVLTHNQVKYDVEIEADLEAGLPPFKGLAQEMGQVFMNLIMNGRDAVKEKGLVKKDGRIFVSTRYNAEKNCVEARFRDNGTGIDRKVIDRIFDPFFTTKAIGSGTGLGLNLCHRIVETHGGDIVVESTPGEGTTFIVRLYVQPVQVG